MRALYTAVAQRPTLRTLSLFAMLIVPLCSVAEAESPRRCVTIDVFAEKQDSATDATLKGVNEFAAARDGVVVVRRFPGISESDRDDLRRLAAAVRAAGDFQDAGAWRV